MLTETDEGRLAATGVDAVALKPSECSIERAAALPVETLAIDYEGREHLPEPAAIADLAEDHEVYVTTPVRADGFDPLGDDSLVGTLPDGVGRVLVAGHPAYLSESETARAVAPRLGAARERAPAAWVGTEGIERVALAAGGTQYELCSRRTEREVRALRAAGFDGEVALYAPLVLTDSEDEILDAVGDYVARRGPVAAALPDGAPTDASATGRAREVLSAASRDYAIVGDLDAVRERIDDLRAAGVTTVVGYPARGLDAVLS